MKIVTLQSIFIRFNYLVLEYDHHYQEAQKTCSRLCVDVISFIKTIINTVYGISTCINIEDCNPFSLH